MIKLPEYPGPAYLKDMPDELRNLTVPKAYMQMAEAGLRVLRGRGHAHYRGMNASADIYEHFTKYSMSRHADGSVPSESSNRDLATETAMAITWGESGCPRFVLSESLAAMLSMTKAPPMQWDRLPFACFIVEVPYKFLPIQTMYIKQPLLTHLVIGKMQHLDEADKLQTIGMTKALCEPFGRNIVGYHFQESIREDQVTSNETDPHLAKLVVRLIANTVAYITQYKECVQTRNKSSKIHPTKVPQQIFDVKLPTGVVVERTLRERAVELVGARSMSEMKSALKHWVTGHWKNQSCGTGHKEHKMKWIEPYLRGNEDMGTVIEAIIKVES